MRRHLRVLPAQRGVTLVIVLILLVIVTLLGIGGARIALLGERSTRNDRDYQVAWQAAEAALIDAEMEMYGTGTSTRRATFDSKNQVDFVNGCGTTGNALGLCMLNLSGKPAWLVADFTNNAVGAMTVPLGQFTLRTFAAGAVGIQPAKVPRYAFEMIQDPIGDRSNPTFLYRVTAMGFGPRDDIQSVVQMIYRI